MSHSCKILNFNSVVKYIILLDHSASGRQLVTMVEQLASNHDDTSLMAQIVEQIGLTTPAEWVVNVLVAVRVIVTVG